MEFGLFGTMWTVRNREVSVWRGSTVVSLTDLFQTRIILCCFRMIQFSIFVKVCCAL